MRIFDNDDGLGQLAVDRVKYYFGLHNIFYREATINEQHNGIDIVTDKGTIEIKHQTYPDSIVVEDSDGLRDGWIYTSKADYLFEVSDHTLLSFKMQELRELYGKTKELYTLNHNDETKGNRGDIWRGTYRVIPLTQITPYIKVKSTLLFD